MQPVSLTPRIRLSSQRDLTHSDSAPLPSAPSLRPGLSLSSQDPGPSPARPVWSLGASHGPLHAEPSSRVVLSPRRSTVVWVDSPAPTHPARSGGTAQPDLIDQRLSRGALPALPPLPGVGPTVPSVPLPQSETTDTICVEFLVFEKYEVIDLERLWGADPHPSCPETSTGTPGHPPHQ